MNKKLLGVMMIALLAGGCNLNTSSSSSESSSSSVVSSSSEVVSSSINTSTSITSSSELISSSVSSSSSEVSSTTSSSSSSEVSSTISSTSSSNDVSSSTSTKEDGESFVLPNITFGQVEDKVVVYAVQGMKEKQYNTLSKKLDRHFRKLNKDVDMEDEILSQVSVNALVSVVCFMAYVQANKTNATARFVWR